MTFTSINICILAGKISRYGVKLSYLPSGKPTLEFALILERPVGDRTFTTYVPVQVFGSHVEDLAERLEPGDLVLISAGSLNYKADRGAGAGKTDKRPATLAVSTFAVEVLQRASVPETSTPPV
jgi:single-stranded DNA-binding protein